MKTVWEIVENPSGLDSGNNYMGQRDFPGMYCLLTQNRDSEALTRSNWTVAIDQLGGEGENVEIHRFGHWACGWWELLAVRENTPEFDIALEIEEKLKGYPVLNEENYYTLEYTEASDFWNMISIKERLELCQEYRVSIFAARHPWLPETPTGELIC